MSASLWGFSLVTNRHTKRQTSGDGGAQSFGASQSEVAGLPNVIDPPVGVVGRGVSASGRLRKQWRNILEDLWLEFDLALLLLFCSR